MVAFKWELLNTVTALVINHGSRPEQEQTPHTHSQIRWSSSWLQTNATYLIIKSDRLLWCCSTPFDVQFSLQSVPGYVLLSFVVVLLMHVIVGLKILAKTSQRSCLSNFTVWNVNAEQDWKNSQVHVCFCVQCFLLSRLHFLLRTVVPDPDCVSIQSMFGSTQFEIADVIALREVCPNSQNIKVYSKCNLKVLVDFVYSYVPQCFAFHCYSLTERYWQDTSIYWKHDN